MRTAILLLSMLLMLASCGYAQVDFTLALNGVAQQNIVIPANHTAALETTANELAGFLNQITGGTFAVVHGDGSYGIVLGRAADFPGQNFTAEVPWTSPEDNERFLIRSEASRLSLVGTTDVACQDAVYAFLQSQGCRMYLPNPNWYVIPQHSTFTVNLNKTDVPDFKMRAMWGYQEKPSWCSYMAEWDKFNLRAESYHINSGHAYHGVRGWIVSQGLWLPEYDSLINGVRVPDSQFCISNPGLRQAVCQYVAAAFAGNPEETSVSLDPNDGSEWCECAACAAMGSVTDRVVTLANEAAEYTQAQFPDKYIGIYAYNQHSPPPTITVNPRVRVLVATGFITGGYTYEELVDLWSQKASDLGMRTYFSLFGSDYGLPGLPYASNLDWLEERLTWSYDHDISAISAEGTGNFGAHGLGYYLATKLLWDTDSDVDALKSEFLTDCFGPAAATMGQFYELIDRGNGPLMSEHYLAQLWHVLAQARDDADTDGDGDDADDNPAVSRRLDDLCFWMRYVDLRFDWFQAIGDAPTFQALGEAMLRHTWKIRKTSMIDTWDCWRYMPVTHPAGYEWIDNPHPWKEDTYYTHSDAMAMMNQGLADDQLLEEVERVTFNTNLVPSGLAPMLRSDEPMSIRSNTHYLYLYPKNGVLPTVYFSTGFISTSDGAARWSLYDASGTMRESGTIPPDLTTHAVNFTTTGSGPFMLTYDDNSASSNYDVQVGGYASMVASPEHPILSLGRVGRFYFFVPKDTTNVVFYASEHSDFRVYDASSSLRYEATEHGDWQYIIIPVPAGKDNQVWFISNLAAESFCLINCPPYVAQNADELLIPAGVKYNYAPVATDDAYYTLTNTRVTRGAPGVLANDSDQNNDSLTVALASGPSHGTLALDPKGSFTYDPASGYTGIDTFTYRVIDGCGAQSGTATVTLTIQALPANGLRLWLKADANVTMDASNVVSTWGDSSGNGFNAIQTNSVKRPVWVADAVSGYPTLRFDGTDDTLRLPSPATIGLVACDQEFFVVGKLTTATNSGFLIGSTAARFQMSVNNGTAGYKYSPTSTSTSSCGSGTQYVNAFHTFAGRAIAGTATARVDGVDGAPVAVTMSGMSNTTNLLVGSRLDSGYYWQGDIAEVIVYNRALTTDERRMIEDYLQSKYTNAAPVAQDDAYALATNQTLATAAPGVLSNDSDVNQQTLTAVPVSGPSHSSAFTLNANGSFSYTPVSGFTGVDTFTYKVVDPEGAESAPVYVRLTVLPAMRVWLRADAGITKDGNNQMTSWADQSGNGFHATQATVTKQPVWTSSALNTLPTVRFDGLDDTLRMPSPGTIGLVASDQEHFAVAKLTVDSGRFIMGSTAVRFQMSVNNGTAGYKYSPTSTSTSGCGSGNQYINAFHLFAGRAIAGTATARVDGVDGTPIAVTMSGMSETTNMLIGSRTDSGYYWQGDIAEVLMFNRALTATERQLVESYLRTKYAF